MSPRCWHLLVSAVAQPGPWVRGALATLLPLLFGLGSHFHWPTLVVLQEPGEEARGGSGWGATESPATAGRWPLPGGKRKTFPGWSHPQHEQLRQPRASCALTAGGDTKLSSAGCFCSCWHSPHGLVCPGGIRRLGAGSRTGGTSLTARSHMGHVQRGHKPAGLAGVWLLQRSTHPVLCSSGCFVFPKV